VEIEIGDIPSEDELPIPPPIIIPQGDDERTCDDVVPPHLPILPPPAHRDPGPAPGGEAGVGPRWSG